MQSMRAARAAARKILGPRLTALTKQPFRRMFATEYRSHLRLRRGLEIGGPSTMFAGNGELPIYDVLGSLYNCLCGRSTIWTGGVREGNTFLYDPAKQPGVQIICEATDLQPIKDSSCECVLACHCLEHIANPLRALAEQ